MGGETVYAWGNAKDYGAVLAMTVILLSGCQGFALLDQPPEASFTVSANPRVGEPVVLDASTSHDPQGYELTYEWEFRAPSQSLSTLDSTKAKRVTFYPDSEATYQVSLKVTARVQSDYSSSVRIMPLGPEAGTFALTIQANEGGSVVPAGVRSLKPNDRLSILAVTSPGYAFQGWSVASGAATFDDATAAQTVVTASNVATKIVATFVSTEQAPEFLVGLAFPYGLAHLGDSGELKTLGGELPLVALARDSSGALYGLGDPITPRGSRLYAIDAGTGQASPADGLPFVEGDSPDVEAGVAMASAAFSPLGVLYVVEESGAHRLFVVNRSTGQVTVVGTPYPELESIAFSPEGTLYGLDGTSLYRVDPNNGSATFLVDVAVPLTSLTFSSEGVLYAVDQLNPATIYALDPKLGTLRSVVTLPGALLSLIVVL